jgi:SAM-dependent methyltransferase
MDNGTPHPAVEPALGAAGAAHAPHAAHPQPGPSRARLKGLLYRAMRPGLADVHAKLDTITACWSESLLHELMGAGAWRGTLADGRTLGPSVPGVDALSEKYRQELAFWVSFVHAGECERVTGADFVTTYGRWQRERMGELARFLGFSGEDELHAWTRSRTAVELGPGPFPSICVAPWRRAIAVDPLADGYAAERLLPPECESVVFIAATGERVPLAGATADIVVIENALDHVDSPRAVLQEIRRLLRPDGLLWLLVDLMNYRDAMHPNPFTEHSVRALLAETGFAVVKDRVSEHKSHPEAYGEYRGLLRRMGAPPPEIVTRVHAPLHA